MAGYHNFTLEVTDLSPLAQATIFLPFSVQIIYTIPPLDPEDPQDPT